MVSDDKGKLELIAFKSFPSNPGLIYIIDFLNKSLKEKKIMFGLSKDKEKDEMIINIYEF
jgi:hypothetical protein